MPRNKHKGGKTKPKPKPKYGLTSGMLHLLADQKIRFSVNNLFYLPIVRKPIIIHSI